MKKINRYLSLVDRHLGCFGNFDGDDPLCKKHCAINLRCAIERDQNTRLEVLEDLVSFDDMFLKMQ